MPFFGRIVGGGVARPKGAVGAATVEIEMEQYVLVEEPMSDFEEIGVDEHHDDVSSSSSRDVFVVNRERFERVEKRDSDVRTEQAADDVVAGAVQPTRISQHSKRGGCEQTSSARSAMTAPGWTGAPAPVAGCPSHEKSAMLGACQQPAIGSGRDQKDSARSQGQCCTLRPAQTSSASKKSDEGMAAETPTVGSLATQQATATNSDSVPQTDESDWPLLNGTGYLPLRGVRPFKPVCSIPLCGVRPRKPARSSQSSDAVEGLRSDFAGLSLGYSDGFEIKREDEEVLRQHRRAQKQSLQASRRDYVAMLEAPTRAMAGALGKSNTQDGSRGRSDCTSTTLSPPPSADASPHIPGLMMSDKPVSSQDVVRNARRLDERSSKLLDPIITERRVLEARLLRSMGCELDADGKWQQRRV